MVFLIHQVFFCIIVGATQIGQAAPNIQDIANAKGAAYYIYDLMDHVRDLSQKSLFVIEVFFCNRNLY